MKKSDIEVIRELLKSMTPISKVERLVAIGGIVIIDLYALSQGINNGLTIFLSSLIGGIVGYSIHVKRDM